MKNLARPHHSFPHRVSLFSQTKKVDLTMFISIVILSILGLLMVYDSSQFDGFRNFSDSYYYIKQQAMWMVLGYLGLGFFSIFDYHKLAKYAIPLFYISIFLLIIVIIPGVGISAYGAHRWLKISFLTIQPAEIIKLAAVIFFAKLFEKKVITKPFIIYSGLIIFIIGLLQKDLGSSVVFALIAYGVYFIAGAPIQYILGFLVAGGVAMTGFILTASYRIQRVLAFLDPFADPEGYTYHISQVLIALGSGGLLGLGIGQSRQKFAYIPEVSTDSIFSVVGEEFGFLGALVLIFAIGFVVYRGFTIAERAPDRFGKLIASGLTLWIGAQAVVNLAAMVSLIPLTGVPLPFISYGGSALLANLVAVGILLNISRQSNQ